MSKNPTLLTLLKQGCKIEFPSGYSFTGETKHGYIHCATPFGADGCWSLDAEGLKNACNDEKKYKKANNSN